MQGPSPSQAYAMIRVLKKRGGKGDGEKIAELQQIIDEDFVRIAFVFEFLPAKK